MTASKYSAPTSWKYTKQKVSAFAFFKSRIFEMPWITCMTLKCQHCGERSPGRVQPLDSGSLNYWKETISSSSGYSREGPIVSGWQDSSIHKVLTFTINILTQARKEVNNFLSNLCKRWWYLFFLNRFLNCYETRSYQGSQRLVSWLCHLVQWCHQSVQRGYQLATCRK